MLKKLQTKHGINGNCLASCLASILNTDIENIPNVETLFPLTGKDEHLWAKVLTSFLSSYEIEWEILDVNPTDPPTYLNLAYLIVNGIGNNSGRNHAVIYRRGELYHDPSPSKKGIDESKIIQVTALKLGNSYFGTTDDTIFYDFEPKQPIF